MEALTIIIFLIGLIIAFWIGQRVGSFRKHKEWEKELPSYRKEAIAKSRSVLSGLFSEQLAPFLPNFNFNPTECRFVGKPIDFICFRGLDNKNVEEVVFVEVKSGNAKLSATEKKLRDAVEKKKVRWEEYRVDKKLTDVEDIEEKREFE